MFKLRGPHDVRKTVAGMFAEALLALPAKIDVLQKMEVGINENPDEDWDLVLTATLPSMKDVAVYASHPDHLAAAAIIRDYKEARACVDYSC